MSLHYSWGNPLNCLYTIFKVVKILTLNFTNCLMNCTVPSIPNTDESMHK